MKVFHRTEPWPSKVNFEDENNVALGYDLAQDCCEAAGWFIADEIASFPPLDSSQNFAGHPNAFPQGGVYELQGWRFDPAFRAVITHRDFDEGKMVVFRIMNGSKAEKFIHIFNAHNGYYSHGFTFSGQGFVTIEDSI